MNWSLIISIAAPIIAIVGIMGTINAYILSMIREQVKDGFASLNTIVDKKQDKVSCAATITSCTKINAEKEETLDRDLRMLNKRLGKHKHENGIVVFIAE